MIAWLVTWLWQGMALTLLVAVAVRLLPSPGAAGRHVIWWMTLAGVLWLAWPARPFPVAPLPGAGAVTEHGADALLVTMPALPEVVIALLIALWGAGAAVRLIRLGSAAWELRRTKARARPFPPAREQRLAGWCRVRLSGRRARLMVSDETAGVSLFGLTRPQILFGRELVDRFTDEDLDLMALHEHAHLQRLDDWTNLLQSAVKAALGFHPAIRWIDDRLTLEREMACDDWVVARRGGARQYARCLVRVAEWQAARRTVLAAPAFFGSARGLAARIDRLVTASPARRTRPSGLRTAAGLGVVVIAHGVLAALPPMIAEDSADSRPGSIAVPTGPSRVLEHADAGRATVPPIDPSATLVAPARRAVKAVARPSAPVMTPRPVERLAASRSGEVVRAIEPPERAMPAPGGLGSTEVRLDAAPTFGAALPSVRFPSAVAALPESPRADIVSVARSSGNRAHPGAVAAWTAAAGLGKSIGQGATRAGQATANTFRRAGLSIAGAFIGSKEER